MTRVLINKYYFIELLLIAAIQCLIYVIELLQPHRKYVVRRRRTYWTREFQKIRNMSFYSYFQVIYEGLLYKVVDKTLSTTLCNKPLRRINP